MTLLTLGISHRSAPMRVLERAALDAPAVDRLIADVLAGSFVNGAAVLATCNRLEVIADVTTFHGGLADIGGALVDAMGIEWTSLTEHLYVHYEDRAVEHLLTVACGLDSMALGEAQVLGQLRGVLSKGQADGSLSSPLDQMLQQALRVGKRAHSETGLDGVAQSLLSAALDFAPGWIGDLREAKALVVGAGAMSGLAVATLARLGLGRITIANRTLGSAERLAAGVAGRAVGIDAATLRRELADADLIVSCTGARGIVLGPGLVDDALELRTTTATAGDGGTSGDPDASSRQFFVDLALPADVDPEVGARPEAKLIGLEQLANIFAESPRRDSADVTGVIAAVREIVASETRALTGARKAAAVTPTVVALRERADDVVSREFARLEAKLRRAAGGADGSEPPGTVPMERLLAEVRKSLRRVADKLMHTPTVRVKELAAEPDGGSYAEALRTLFDLDVEARGPVTVLPPPGSVFDAQRIMTPDDVPAPGGAR